MRYKNKGDKMKKAVIYGNGVIGIHTLWQISLDCEVLCFINGDSRRQNVWGGGGQ